MIGNKYIIAGIVVVFVLLAIGMKWINLEKVTEDITEPFKLLILEYPNGGEILSGTEIITWKWENDDPSSWSINIYWGSNQENAGTLVFNIPGNKRSWSFYTNSYPNRDDYYLEIVNNDNPGQYHDMSNAAFEIRN